MYRRKLQKKIKQENRENCKFNGSIEKKKIADEDRENIGSWKKN